MNRSLLCAATAALIHFTAPMAGMAQQETENPKLHVDPQWEECAIRLDPALTQDAWRQFAEEGALVVYIRPLTDARPMGAGAVEVSVHNWATAIDDAEPAWNDTFVHPTEDHYLTEGSTLGFPGLMVRAGVTDRMDVGAYVTKNPGSNYGFAGGLIQHDIVNDTAEGWAGAGRMSVVTLFGPEDVGLTVFGLDLVASKTFAVNDWMTISPYVTGSGYLSYARESSSVVNLESETVPGMQAMVGAAVEIYQARLAAEISAARVSTFAIKLGVEF